MQAIKYGSRVPEIQQIAQDIFIWCMRNGKICWPVWLPRTHPVIEEGDKRSRLTIPHDDRSPQEVVDRANEMALGIWDRPLSFDQAASHVTAVSIGGIRLPFNAFCAQNDAAGVDMFLQWGSWKSNINYVYPPVPMTGWLLTFLPQTKSAAIVGLKLPFPCAW